MADVAISWYDLSIRLLDYTLYREIPTVATLPRNDIFGSAVKITI